MNQAILRGRARLSGALLALCCATVLGQDGSVLQPAWQRTLPGTDAEPILPLQGGLQPAVDRSGATRLLGVRGQVLWTLDFDPVSGQHQVRQMPTTLIDVPDARVQVLAEGLLLSQAVQGHVNHLNRCTVSFQHADGSVRWTRELHSSGCPTVLGLPGGGAAYVDSSASLVLVDARGAYQERPAVRSAGTGFGYGQVLPVPVPGRLLATARSYGDAYAYGFLVVLDSQSGRLLGLPLTRNADYGPFLAWRPLAGGALELLFASLDHASSDLLRLRLDAEGRLLDEQRHTGLAGRAQRAEPWQQGFVVLAGEETSEGRLLALDAQGQRWARDVSQLPYSIYASRIALATGPAGEVALGLGDNVLRFDAAGRPQPTIARAAQQLRYDQGGLLWAVHPASREAELVAYAADGVEPLHASQVEVAPVAAAAVALEARADGQVHALTRSNSLRRLYLHSLDAAGNVSHAQEVPWRDTRILKAQRLAAGWIVLADPDDGRSSPYLAALDLAGRELWRRDVIDGSQLLCDQRATCQQIRHDPHRGSVLERFDFNGAVDPFDIPVGALSWLQPGPGEGSLRLVEREAGTGDQLLYALESWPTPRLLARIPNRQFVGQPLGDALLARDGATITLHEGLQRLWTRSLDLDLDRSPFVFGNRHGQLRQLEFIGQRRDWLALDPATGLELARTSFEFGSGSLAWDSVGFGMDWIALSGSAGSRVLALRHGQPERSFPIEAQTLVALPGNAALVSWMASGDEPPVIRVARLELPGN